MLSMTWLCENSFHPEEVWTVGAAAAQYLSGLLAWCKRKKSLKKGSMYTCWVRSHLNWSAGEKRGVETCSEQRGLKLYLHGLCNLKAGRGEMKKVQGAFIIIYACAIHPWFGSLGSWDSALPETETFLWECDTSRGMSHELFKEQFWLYSYVDLGGVL